jgi:adenylosuccinate lyase
MAISPLDGRYANKLSELQPICSEYGLIKYRVEVELQWLISLLNTPGIIASENIIGSAKLINIKEQFNLDDAAKVKSIEATTNHDVKAVEYFLQEKFKADSELEKLIPFIHFACTSEDINNLAYGLMLLDSKALLCDGLQQVIKTLSTLAQKTAEVSMLSRTHGQSASPTTLGKELMNVVKRLERQVSSLQSLDITGKCNGAVGNYNAHLSAYPEIDWPAVSNNLITSLGLEQNTHTTQIEPHDNLAEFLHNLSRINTILIDCAQDNWQYISKGFFKLQLVDGEVGSSTMPHKVNPIDFENAEGNLGLANALAQHLASKLPISRLQRDLSDSTVLRNLGVIFGHSLLAFKSLQKGLGKLAINATAINDELEQRWEVLAEPIQTILRAQGVTDAYEQLKQLTRGEKITQKSLHNFINSLTLDEKIKFRLLALTPQNYIGLAATLAKDE